VLIEISRSDCGFNDNQCVQYSSGTEVAVSITAGTCTCSSNRVTTPSKLAISLICPASKVAVVGNITSGQIEAGVPPVALAGPWQTLNIHA